MKDFRQLKMWQAAHQLVLAVYQTSDLLPKQELFGLTSQIRRSALSIPSNIAEGCGRDGDGELFHFIRIAIGSANELDYQLQLAHDLGYISPDNYQILSTKVVEVRKMMFGFLKSSRPFPGH